MPRLHQAPVHSAPPLLTNHLLTPPLTTRWLSTLQRQEAKIAATSKELAHEEQQRVDVKSAAAKLLAEAQKQDNSQALQRKVARAKDAAELQFEKVRTLPDAGSLPAYLQVDMLDPR